MTRDPDPSSPTPALAAFERMLAAGKDGALLRYSLGNEYERLKEYERAIAHLKRAVEFDPSYTAAWKMLGRSLVQAGHAQEALAAYREGIAVAAQRGDKQAQKEMEVFARRIERALKA
jgi:predicted Zn-dependent protease